MWGKVIVVLLEILTKVGYNVAEWWLASQIKKKITAFMNRRKK